MQTFTDAKGQNWTIDVNFTSLKRVKAATGIDLTKLVNPKSDVIGTLTGDLFVLFDCLVALVQPQLDAKELTAEQFGESLDEGAAESAVVALIAAVIDFFPEGKRMLLKRAFAKVTTAAQRRQTSAIDQALKAVESVQFERTIEHALERASRSTSGSLATNSPASSASTLAP